ncbi:nSTAND3 domain-containing NTPase [Blastococcus sp. SYSU DS0539]
MTTPDYQLHTLGWRAFQDLAQVVLRDVLGQQLEVYSDTRDVGQDGAFAGKATPAAAGELSGIHGAVIAQMKHTTKAGARLAASDVEDELSKVERLVARGLCDSYILITNSRVTGAVATKVKEALRARGVQISVVLGHEWLSQTIRDSPRMRALVPRVYGLGDLSQILDERIYAQTQALLESLKDDLATFVVTDGYREAIDALEQHGFVLLLGEPGAGKTVTAATIATAASDLWGLQVAQIDHPSAMRHWNPNEPQLLWADDAFGAMNLNQDLMDSWNRALSLVRAIVRKRSRIILTSRDYIWRAARRHLKESAFPFLEEERVTIDVTSFSRDEKEKILYAHLRAGRQPQAFRAAAKPHLRALCGTIDLLPETARRLADPFFTTGLNPSSMRDVQQFLTHPRGYLKELLEKLDAPHEAAVALVFTHDGHLACPFTPTPGDEGLISSIGATVPAVRQALGNLGGTLLRTDAIRGEYAFRHPSIGDAYAELLTNQPEKLVIWLRGAPLRQILTEATVDIDDPDRPGVAVPPSLRAELVARMDRASAEHTTQIVRFLADRCSPEFARGHLAARVHLLEPLTHPGMYLYRSSPSLVLLGLLRERGILPESARLEFAKHIAENALDGPDPAWCSIDMVREVLTESELQSIRQAVREALVTDEAQWFTDAWDTYNYPGTDWGSPGTWVEPLRDAVNEMRGEFIDDKEATQGLDWLERHAQYLEETLSEDHPEYDVREVGSSRRQAPERQASARAPRRHTGRDPFDDVDS